MNRGTGRTGNGARGLVATLVAAAFALVLIAPGSASALELQPVADFDEPVFVTSDPADPDRLFVVEKGGTITLFDHGTKRPFLDIHGSVLNSGEQGLLSMAFDPGYATNGRFYVYYVTTPPAGRSEGDLRIAEFRVNASGNAALPGSRRVLITIPHPTNGNHNGGQLQIGPDGYLYIGTGDGGGGGDPDENAQDLSSLLGKILRIDPDPPTPGEPGYTIPPGNPFAGATPGRDEIWAYGVRNPWRFSFDRLNGALTIGDVGQSSWEEIDYVRQSAGGGRGLNFGWDCREGAHPFESAGCPGFGAFTEPVFEYPHSDGRCSITGGYVSHDPGIPNYEGRYFYADICAGPVRSLLPGNGTAGGSHGDRSAGVSVSQPSSFGEDSCGRLYVASLGSGEVFRIEGSTPTVCGDDPPPPPSDDDGPCAPSDQLGTSGPDELRGGGGRNALSGRGGPDTIRGGGAADCLDGSRGKDELRGGRGGDELFPGAGHDEARGGRGPDVIWADDGKRDRVECGRGRKDVAHVDSRDRVGRSCERVR